MADSVSTKQNPPEFQSDDMLIFGPAECGKTVLLASLGHAANHVGRHEDVSFFLQPLKGDANTAQLFRTANEGLARGAFPFSGDINVVEYKILIEIRKKMVWDRLLELFSRNKGAKSSRTTRCLSVLDGPGGALFPSTGSQTVSFMLEYRNLLLERLRACRNLIFCIDPTTCDALIYYNGLMDILNNLGSRYLPAEKIVIVLTKADKHFSNYQEKAHALACTSDPLEALRRALPGPAWNMLLNYAGPSAEIGVSFCSAYGFLEQGPLKGYPNYNPNTGGLTHAGPGFDPGETIDMWRPFQVLSPLRYICVNDRSGIRLVQR